MNNGSVPRNNVFVPANNVPLLHRPILQQKIKILLQHILILLKDLKRKDQIQMIKLNQLIRKLKQNKNNFIRNKSKMKYYISSS
jgi:hypothetical protein